ncbi:MAG: DEAD/DEAH box helicase [Candidatus Marinimicrobia bacterium]|jgi:DEAD/DEAH box helicase domain-containing protein|nr:DEAD/DEAH box helicase [Candidatus Neomarinimicrobiota bacterium]MDP6592836.1 DEAD/DEAH box helicase [Candidatus Neomarinimicrobiota bacterium]|tara:strand:- start:4038 stop:6428 length:2391 start_codon:yes stop_codon:yes gene_type:complete
MEPHTDVSRILDFLKSHPEIGPHIEHVHHIPASEGQYVDFPDDLDGRIVQAVQSRGIEQLYSHQRACWDHISDGDNIVVVTPTASGKTLCYNLPVLQSALNDPGAKVLYLFPTKALSQDQVAELNEVVDETGEPVKVYTFDGDTPQSARQAIRKQGNVVVTNPDMLHQGILPHHTKWISLFQNLKYVVIDELHIYRGVFGSHMANLIRRLKRVCEFHGSSPQFIGCSATIANPREHAEALTESEMTLVDQSGSPRSEKYFIFYNPPVVNHQLGIRASYIKQARQVGATLLKNDISTIVFALSRLNVEILTKYLKDEFESSRERLASGEVVAGYRGGYLPNRRREIEKGLRTGEIKGVVATNALELGIDIGSLDAAVLAGYPGTIASTWQQAGRAGRRGRTAVAVLIARSNPLDQFLMSSPDYFFGSSVEHARINPDNLTILVDHMKCAAFELPFRKREAFGEVTAGAVNDILEFLAEGSVVHLEGDQWHWMEDVYPAVNVSLRRIEKGNFVVVKRGDESKIIAEVDYTSSITTIYPDAIYMTDGREYIVDDLDWDGRKAIVRNTDSDYYTDAIDYTNVKVLDEFESRRAAKVDVSLGEVQVMTRAVGFKKIKFYTMENVGYGDINLPDMEMHTTAYWFTLPEELLSHLSYSRTDIVDGVLGLVNALHYICALNLMCTVHDIYRSVGDKSAEWYVRNVFGDRGLYSAEGADLAGKQVSPGTLTRFQPTIFIYDNYQGGVGFSQQLYDSHEELLTQTHSLISKCMCKSGCPSCVGPAAEVGEKSRDVSLAILEAAGYR